MLVKIGPAMLVVVACLILAYTVEALERVRPWKPGDPVPFWNVLGRPFESEATVVAQEHAEIVDAVADEILAAEEPLLPPARQEEAPIAEMDLGPTLPPYRPSPDDDKEVVQPLELFSGHELDRFFSSLARSDAKIAGAVTHVVHWGDSAIGLDGIPSAIRRRMQNRFGDSGHGFHLMSPPNTSYRHAEVRFSHNGGWSHCFIIQKCRKDGHYGLGGATFRSTGGAQSTFAPHPERSSGRVSKMEVWYAAQPGGGRLRLVVDGGEKIFVDTDAETLEDRFYTFELEDGMHDLEVRAAGGRVRVYGVTLERDAPGVVWDGLAFVGAFTNRMLEYDEDHLRTQLEHRSADLAVFTFGGNDMIRNMTMEQYVEEYRQVIARVRAARPQIDCLIMAPLDHGVRKGVRIVTRPIVPKMVEAQRVVARTEGCAFFDTFTAMGGEGSAGRWFKRKPRLMSGDLGHATHNGHQVIGELFYRALLRAYIDYRERMEAQGGIPVDAGTASTAPEPPRRR